MADAPDFLFQLLGKYICGPRSPRNRVIHIKGQNGLGKSIFIRTLLDHLYGVTAYSGHTYIFDTETKYSRAAIDAAIQPPHRQHIFLTYAHEFSELLALVQKFDTMNLPPKSLLVIDSLSNVLKILGAEADSYLLLKAFNSIFLTKLVALLAKKDLFCVMVHHISYNPVLGNIPAYFASVVQNLEGIWLSLEKSIAAFEDHEPYFEHTVALSYCERTYDSLLHQFCIRYAYSLHHGKFILGGKVDG